MRIVEVLPEHVSVGLLYVVSQHPLYQPCKHILVYIRLTIPDHIAGWGSLHEALGAICLKLSLACRTPFYSKGCWIITVINLMGILNPSSSTLESRTLILLSLKDYSLHTL